MMQRSRPAGGDFFAMLFEVMSKVGKDGVITVEEAQALRLEARDAHGATLTVTGAPVKVKAAAPLPDALMAALQASKADSEDQDDGDGRAH